MGGLSKSKIPYLKEGRHWPVEQGCSACGPACDNCWAAANHGKRHQLHLAGKSPAFATPFSEIVCREDLLDAPSRLRRPTVIGVAFGGDLYHPEVPDEFIFQVLARMAKCSWHAFVTLTKRTDRMVRCMQEFVDLVPYLSGLDERSFGGLRWGHGEAFPPVPLPNVIFMGTAWDEESLDRVAGDLGKLSDFGCLTGLSLEPLLEPVNIQPEHGVYGGPGNCLDWVVAGCEAIGGTRVGRPSQIEWFQDIEAKCRMAGVPCFIKQVEGCDGSLVKYDVTEPLRQLPPLLSRVW